MTKVYHHGHAGLRFTTEGGKVIYVDPYIGEGYDIPADLILVTHQHDDHNNIALIKNRNPGCHIICEKEALKDGKHQSFDFGFVTVEATEVQNKNHDRSCCVGYILGFEDGLSVYISGDTDKIPSMYDLAKRNFDYAFFCCDGIYNMDIEEASECAAIVGARHSTPVHMIFGELFSKERAERFEAKGRIIIPAGEEIELVKE